MMNYPDSRGTLKVAERDLKSKNVLVMGIGAFAFGRARRAVRMLTHMSHIHPYFLISKYEDGTVSRLLNVHSFAYEHVPLGYLGRAKPTWTLTTLSQVPWLYYRTLAAYSEQKCDTILILSVHPLLNALPPILWLRHKARANIVIYFGDIPTNHLTHRVVGRIINRLTDRVVVNSRAVQRGLVQIGVTAHNVQVVYNGVDPYKFTDGARIDFDRLFNWPPHTIHVGFIGQFTRNKGGWDFVRAAEQVITHNPRCRFVMIGKLDQNNHYQQELVEYINVTGLQEYIGFTGWIDDMAGAYGGLDVVVVPSRYEDPAPNVNIEAMASGLPVIATRAGGSPELIADGETGLLVSKDNPAQIAECILTLAEDGELRDEMGRAGKKRVQQMFNVHKNARLVQKLILNG